MRLGVSAALVDGHLLPGDVVVDDGRVASVGVVPAGRSGIAAAGLVDLQVNGYRGVDVATADVDGLVAVRRDIAADGVTAFAPTVITGSPDATAAAVARIAAAARRSGASGAAVLGSHLEGPWISPARLGTHPAGHRRDPGRDPGRDPAGDPTGDRELEQLLAAGHVAVVTLAPELPGALDTIRRLVARGVVVLVGHTDATAQQTAAAFDAGASGATHLFNAMRPLGHRDPGPVGAVLTRPGAVATLICDGQHLAAETVRLAFAAAPGRIALVTDATAASGMPDGEYVLGDVAVTLSGGAVRNAAGALAGSAATLAGCVRGAVAAGIDVRDALHAATAVPADLMRRGSTPVRPGLGVLRLGGVADVVVLDDDLTVRDVLIDGSSAR